MLSHRGKTQMDKDRATFVPTGIPLFVDKGSRRNQQANSKCGSYFCTI